jgi:hypothetical protein
MKSKRWFTVIETLTMAVVKVEGEAAEGGWRGGQE